MARVSKSKPKTTKKQEGNKIVVKKSQEVFDVFVSNTSNFDYFCIKPEHYSKDDKELIKVIKTKTDIKLTKEDINKIVNVVRTYYDIESTNEVEKEENNNDTNESTTDSPEQQAPNEGTQD